MLIADQENTTGQVGRADQLLIFPRSESLAGRLRLRLHDG